MLFGKLALSSLFRRGEEIRKCLTDIVTKIQEYIEAEMRSCSMDYGSITLLYVYKMWGGTLNLEDIERAISILEKRKFLNTIRLNVVII